MVSRHVAALHAALVASVASTSHTSPEAHAEAQATQASLINAYLVLSSQVLHLSTAAPLSTTHSVQLVFEVQFVCF